MKGFYLISYEKFVIYFSRNEKQSFLFKKSKHLEVKKLDGYTDREENAIVEMKEKYN